MKFTWVRPKGNKLAHAVFFGEEDYTEFYCGQDTAKPVVELNNPLHYCPRCALAVEKANRNESWAT